MTPEPLFQTDALIRKIESAFADVSYPGDTDLTDSNYGDEPEALVRAFQGKTDWHELDAKFLDDAPEGWHNALSFFSNAAFQFYLPAYLIADIRDELMEQDPAFHLCINLSPAAEQCKIATMHGGGTMGSLARARFDQFSSTQTDAIVAYLYWKMDSIPIDDPTYPDIAQAMDYYWLKREEPTQHSSN